MILYRCLLAIKNKTCSGVQISQICLLAAKYLHEFKSVFFQKLPKAHDFGPTFKCWLRSWFEVAKIVTNWFKIEKNKLDLYVFFLW